MGSNTSVHNLYKPDAGEDGWASLVNANFDDLDTLLNGFTTNGENLTLGGTLDVSGATSLESSLEVTATGDKALALKGDSFVGFTIESYRDSSSDHALPNFYAARGTEASPSNLQSGDRVVTFRPRGYGDTGFNVLGDIVCLTTETHTDSAAGQEWEFYTVPNGTTSGVLALELQQDQTVSIPNGDLDVDTGVFRATGDKAVFSGGGNTAGSNTAFDGEIGIELGRFSGSQSYYITFTDANTQTVGMRLNNAELEAEDNAGNVTTLT